MSELRKHEADGHDWKVCDCATCVAKRRVTGVDPPIHNPIRPLNVDLNVGLDQGKYDG